jgi:hypothetical protein
MQVALMIPYYIDLFYFGLFMLKAVLDGRGGELVELAKTNLFR